MGVKVIYEDSIFNIYDVDTYSDAVSVFGSLPIGENAWNQWKSNYNYIYFIVKKNNVGGYMYVPDNDTFKYKDFVLDTFRDDSLNEFQRMYMDAGSFIEHLSYDILYQDSSCTVKSEKLTAERKTYIIIIDGNNKFIYTALSPKINQNMFNYLVMHLDLCENIKEYFDEEIRKELLGE